jgi:3-methyladenine DNA glycosylase AlkC
LKECYLAEKLKDKYFTRASTNAFGDLIRQYYSDFDKDRFVHLVFDDEWESREFKERMRHTTRCLHELLPENYKIALKILIEIAPFVKGAEGIILPDYVELYGMDNWDLSLTALGHFTKYSSSEFAIRPFLHEDPERAMIYMNRWAEDENENVRRFASEGCRPRLPWAMALPQFKKDPSPVLDVLEKLKDDESEFVRRSVANNLNDISKDHPDLVLDICEKWYGQSKRTDWIVKQACRSMLKAGRERALLLFGYMDPSNMSVDRLKLDKKIVAIGEDLCFSFDVNILGEKASKVRLEYGIDFVKANGKRSRKIFKITENTYKSGIHSFTKKQSFSDMSTRKHYEGEHRVAIIVNGVEKAHSDFTVRRNT